ncbi:hypothetical protein EOM57_01050 [Candidatus Saccharibacteria bacterium]|nr:hypothetical protein [Candidatus Saccharibacteria bacterium]
MGDVNVNNTELEYMKLQRIRHELQDYRYHCLRKKWLNEKIEELDIKLDGQIPALKTGEGSGGGSTEGNWIISAIAERDELKSLRKEIERHIEIVDAWLSLIERCLGKETMCILSHYAIMEGYENADNAVDLLKLKSKRTLYRIVARAEGCILENLKNFKNF